MKQTLLFLSVLFLLLATAQAQQQVAIYYNQKWEVTKKEKAVFVRLAAVPDSQTQKGLLYKMNFDKAVADYYNSGKVLARGSYNKGQKQGDWLFYYPNGQLQCQGSYNDDKPSGFWKYWRENGQQEQEILYDTASVKYLNYWSESGRKTVKNGTGKFVTTLPANGDGKVQLKGSFLQGARHGTWRYWFTRDSQRWFTHMEQVYRRGEMVHFITSYKITFEEGDYLMRDRFDLLREFSYLERVEKWTVDSSAFTPDYPVLAYMLKLM